MNNKPEKGEGEMNNDRRLDRDELLKKYSTDELIKHLKGIMDSEIKKSDKMDADLIDECVDWVLELRGIKVELTEEEVKRRVKSILEKHHAKKQRKFRFPRVAAIVAAAAISIQIVAVAAFDVNPIYWVKEQFLALVGKEVLEDNMSYLSSHTRQYKTVEELESAENIDIMIPTWLPGDIEIESMDYAYDYATKRIDIDYTDRLTALSIRLDCPMFSTDGAEVYESNNIVYYVFSEANIIYWEHDGNFYNLTCGFDISDCIEKIIDNVKY